MPVAIKVFQGALRDTVFLTNNSKDSISQVQFLDTLQQSNYSSQELIESINIVQDSKIRSLLIIHLLNRKDYLYGIEGEPIVDRLAYRATCVPPSRLNAWIHQLDVSVLSPTMINKLEPEIAVSILCSIPHFHLLTSIQTDNLIKRNQTYWLIDYLIRNYSSMPNAHHMVMNLMILVPRDVSKAIKEALSPQQKERTINMIIQNLHLLPKVPVDFVTLAKQESHLIFAIQCYLNGHFHKNLIAFIEQVTQSLLKSGHPFTEHAIKLLFSLNYVAELSDNLTPKIAYLTNKYLRDCASKGVITPFYCDEKIHIRRMLPQVHIAATLSTPAKTTGESQVESTDTEESIIVKTIIDKAKQLNCFEYFLIYYQGASQPVTKVINDYLHYHLEQDKSTARDKIINHLGFILMQNRISTVVRNALFDAFLAYPKSCNEQISYRLFSYDALRTIKHFGMQGGTANYQMVVKLCNYAINQKKPEHKPEIIEIAKKALKEAEYELKLSKKTGFFSGVIKYILRCWNYGWTGFFSPKKPVYVIPESTSATHKKTAIQTMAAVQENQPTKAFSSQVEEMEHQPLTQESIGLLFEAMHHYAQKAIKTDEYETRLKIHNLWKRIGPDTELYVWLRGNQEPFVFNQVRLIELALEKKSTEEKETLLTQNDHDPLLKSVSIELKPTMPEQRIGDSRVIPASDATHMLASAADTISSYVSGAADTLSNLVGGTWPAFFSTANPALPYSAPEEESARVGCIFITNPFGRK